MADYWRENFDLSYIVERDWDALREKLNGKMHVYCGTMDNFYLNNAVYMFEARVNALIAAEDDDGASFRTGYNALLINCHFYFGRCSSGHKCFATGKA